MKFWKMNGAGNDFIIIDNRVEKIPHEKMPSVAKTLCERHLSIGADGFMVVEASSKADYRMLFYNSDGSIGEMCGNGARCIARYGYENGLAGDVQRIETDSGIVVGHRMDQRFYKVRLNDVTLLERRDLDVDGRTYECTYVELGTPGLPHAVVPIHGLADYPHVTVRTWERGVEDFTYACGTGSGSVATVLTLAGKASGRNVRIDMPGGRLFIDVERTGEHVDNLYLTGPTNIVCKGDVTDEELL